MCAMTVDVFDAVFVRQEALGCDSPSVGGYEVLGHVNACIEDSDFDAILRILRQEWENILAKFYKPIICVICTIRQLG
jgi:hypothetical protein